MFTRKVSILTYENESIICSYQLIIDIINNFLPTNQIKSINQIKEVLIEQYQKYQNYMFRIANIWKLQGKTIIADKVLLGEITVESAIMNEPYFITNLDLILLAEFYNLPIILLSATKLKENERSFLILNKNDSENYYFILAQPYKPDTIQGYKLFITSKDPYINLTDVNLPIKTDIKISQKFEIDNYLKAKIPIKLPSTKKSIVKKEEEEYDEEMLVKALEDLETPKIRKIESR